MNYFKECKTIDEVKTLYRTLAMENHPDRGGNTTTMQAINSEYAFACAKIAQGQNLSDQETEEIIIESEAYRDAISKIIHLPGLIIELVGVWIWVTGNTYPVKSEIKAAGYLFAPKKKAWYFRTHEFKVHNREGMSLEEIKNKYGSRQINGVNKTQFIAP